MYLERLKLTNRRALVTGGAGGSAWPVPKRWRRWART